MTGLSRRRRLLAAGAILLAAVFTSSVPAAAAPSPIVDSYPGWHKAALDAAPRWQWNANDGYCGETSFIIAGLQFGQYTSQWTARQVASPGIPQTRPSSQLLLGVNDLTAAQGMRLHATRVPVTGTFTKYANWVKNRFLHGDVVIVGMYNNTRMLGETGSGDPTYDHIMPVFGWESARPLKVDGVPRRARPTDLITVSDNGLRTIGPNAPMLYSYQIGDVQRSRSGANAAGGPVYSFPTRGPWHATAITGPVDPTGVLKPVRLTISKNSEGLQNQSQLAAPPSPTPALLTVHVPRPAAETPDLMVYEYESFDVVPVRDFNANAAAASRSWRVTPGEGEWTHEVNIMTSDTRVYRVVPVTAP